MEEVTRRNIKDKIRFLLYPRSVAIIGASRNPKKIGFQVVYNLIKDGYKGKIYPINPYADEILGYKAYPSILDVPDEIDLAMIVVPAEKVPEVIEESAKKDVKAVAVISSGFSEIGRKDLEDKILEICRKHNIPLLGPNIVGVLNTDHNMNLSFCPHLPFRGRITFITQSGALAIGLIGWTWASRIGLSKLISIGNMAMIGFEELIDYLEEDDGTDAILLYIEGVKNGRLFAEVSRKVSIKKPVIAIKAGKSDRGAKAAASHTGSLAGNIHLYETAFKYAGIISADGLEDGFDKALALSLQPPLKGDNVVVVTNGGGAGVLSSDYAEVFGIPLKDIPKDLRERIEDIIPPFGSPKNPIDLTGNAYREDYIKVIDAVLSHDWVDGVVCIYVHAAITDPVEVADGIAYIWKKYRNKPITVCMIGGREVLVANTWLRDNGIPVYPTPKRAVAAMAALREYGRFLEKWT